MTTIKGNVALRTRRPKPAATANAAHPAGGPAASAGGSVIPIRPLDLDTGPRFDAELPIDTIDPDPDNQSRPIDDELIASIRTMGVLEPILVRPSSPGRHELVAGHRRLDASVAAGRTTIPAIIRPLSDREAAMVQAVENLHRADLTPAQQIRAIARCARVGITIDELATRLAVKPAWIKTRLKAMELPAVYLERLDDGVLQWADLDKATKLPTDVIAKLKNPRSWDINDAAREIEASKRLAARKATLTKAGIRIVETKTGTSLTTLFGWGSRSIDKHKTEPCHAVRLEISYGSVNETQVCTAVARHDTGGGSKLRKPKGADIRTDPSTARRIERSTSLLEWATNFITYRTITTDDHDLLYRREIDGVSHQTESLLAALRILRVEKPNSHKSYRDKKTKLHELADIHGAARIALALFLASAVHQYYPGTAPFTYATKHGWTDPHPPEPTATQDDNVDGSDVDDDFGVTDIDHDDELDLDSEGEEL